MHRIRQSTEKALAFVNDVLELSRVESGAALQSQPVDVKSFLDELHPELRWIGESRGVNVNLETCHGAIVTIDRKLMARAILNIVENAVKKSRAHDTVDVKAQVLDLGGETIVRITIADEGPGISEDEMKDLFTKFFQGHNSSSGFGLGLYITKKVVDLHKGDLAACNRALRGSEFSIRLPCIT